MTNWEFWESQDQSGRVHTATTMSVSFAGWFWHMMELDLDADEKSELIEVIGYYWSGFLHLFWPLYGFLDPVSRAYTLGEAVTELSTNVPGIAERVSQIRKIAYQEAVTQMWLVWMENRYPGELRWTGEEVLDDC